MNFDEIMREITSGLTGNEDDDVIYLKEQIEKYKGHELSREITRACSRLIMKYLPRETFEKLQNELASDFEAWDSTIEEVRFNRFKEDNLKALQLIEPLINKADSLLQTGMFRDDSVSEYHCFDEFFEEILYRVVYKPQKDLRKPDGFPFASLYAEYGSLLIDLKRVEEAQEALKKAYQ